MTFKARVYTGPTLVQNVARAFREANIPVTLEGTEHIYVTVEATDPSAVGHNLQADMIATYGADRWTWVERSTHVL